MRYLLGSLLVVGSVLLALQALAQSGAPSPGAGGATSQPASPNPSQSPGSANPSAAVPSGGAVQNVTAPATPVNPSRRFICRAAAMKFKGQDRADQTQLCVEQARLDCLRQAIDQKVVGPQRRDFVENCVGG